MRSAALSPALARVLYVALGALAAFLLFYNLGGRLLWGDEAETATLARNILRFGVPKTFDGVNRITLLGAGVDGNAQDLWTWSPWLQEYVTAASFALFGVSTWSSRLPFAFCGWLAVLGLARVAYVIYRDHRIALAAAALLATSEVFLLHARQCRYYSIAVCAQIGILWGLYALFEGRRRGAWMIWLALVVQFYTNYIVSAANVLLLLVAGCTLARRRRGVPLELLGALAAFLIAAAPWLVYARVGQQTGFIGNDAMRAADKFGYYLREFHFHLIPLVLLLLPLAGLGRAGGVWRLDSGSEAAAIPRADLERHALVFLGIYFAVVAVPPGPFMRYLLPALPVAVLLAAAWIVRYVRWPIVALLLVVTLCATNAVAIATAYPWRDAHTLRAPVVAFARGLVRPYADRFTDVLDFLRREAASGQSLYSLDPEFPLIFYTPLKIIDGRLDWGKLPNPLPDWILSESASGLAVQRAIRLTGPLAEAYDEITIPVHDSPRRSPLPDPDRYQYEQAPLQPFVLYKRKPESP